MQSQTIFILQISIAKKTLAGMVNLSCVIFAFLFVLCSTLNVIYIIYFEQGVLWLQGLGPILLCQQHQG